MCRVLQRRGLDPSTGTGLQREMKVPPGGRNSTEKSKELNLPFLKEPKGGPVTRDGVRSKCKGNLDPDGGEP